MCEGGGNCLKYLKRGWNRTEGRGHKDFKKGGASWVKGGCLKKGEGGWNPLTNYDISKMFKIFQKLRVKKNLASQTNLQAIHDDVANSNKKRKIKTKEFVIYANT